MGDQGLRYLRNYKKRKMNQMSNNHNKVNWKQEMKVMKKKKIKVVTIVLYIQMKMEIYQRKRTQIDFNCLQYLCNSSIIKNLNKFNQRLMMKMKMSLMRDQ